MIVLIIIHQTNIRHTCVHRAANHSLTAVTAVGMERNSHDQRHCMGLELGVRHSIRTTGLEES